MQPPALPPMKPHVKPPVKPPVKTIILMLASLFAVCISFYFKNGIFPLSLLNILVWAFEMGLHELGHTLFGFLFGYFSVPMPMVTWHFERSEILQYIVYFLMVSGCACAWMFLSRSLFALAVAFSIIIFLLSFADFHELITLYAGHGMAIIFGAILVYRAWGINSESRPTNQFILGFIGHSAIINTVVFGYNLRHDPASRAKYNEKHIFGMDNDFIRIAEKIPSLTVETLALSIIILGIFALITSWGIAIFCPPKAKPLININ